MSAEEFMVTLPSNASTTIYPNNAPNSYKVQLPRTLGLEGEYEVALVSIQYPFNWPNFTEQGLAVLAYTEHNKTALAMNCTESRVNVKDKEMLSLFEFLETYIKTIPQKDIYYRYIKMPTGYYPNPGDFADYLTNSFNTGSSVQENKLISKFDPITKIVSIQKEKLEVVKVYCKSKTIPLALGAEYTEDRKVFYFDPTKEITKPGYLEHLSSMYIYCDVIKYQIVGDTQAPLLATLPVQGSPSGQVFWGFNPPYYIPVNQESISSIEIKICTDTGDLVPFDQSGRVVCNLHFRRHRGPW